jgi:hypothetical protein
MDVKRTVTQAGAARLLGIKAGALGSLVARGTIKIVSTSDGLRLVPLAEVERYRAERRPRGRPTKNPANMGGVGQD